MNVFVNFESFKLSKLQWLIPISFSGCFLIYLLTQSVPSGVNGYFYLKQIKYFFEAGQLYFQDKSVAFALPFFLRSILVSDLIAYHLSVGLLLAAFCVLQVRMVLRLVEASSFKISVGTVLLLSLLFYTHPHILFFGLNFYKNLFAATFILLGIDQYFVFTTDSNPANRTAKRPTRKKANLVVSIFAFMLAVLAHKSSLILCGLWLVAAFVFHFHKQKKVLFVLPVLLALMFGAFLLYFPKASAYIEFLKSGFGFSPEYVVWLKSQTRLGNFIFGGYLTLVALVGYLVFLFKTATTPLRVYGAWMLCVLLFALLPIHAIGQNQLGYRWLLLSLSLSLPLVAAMYWRHRFVGGLLLGLHLGQWMYAVPMHQYFLGFQKNEKEFQKITEYVKPNDYLIAHHGLEFYVDYLTGIRARIFLPENPPEGGKVWRIAHVPFGSLRWQPLRREIHQRAILRIGNNYFLMTEEKWLEARKAAIFPPDSWQNPMDKNPGHVYH